jgi:predicted nucleic acid-binding protein
MNYLLDSCALISYILGESEAEKMKDLLFDSKNSFFLNYVNYGEVLFVLGKNGLKKEKLEIIKENLKSFLDIKFLSTDDFDTIEMAADYKIDGGLSYFDALILACSNKHNLTIITKDSEFKKFTSKFKILFL